MYNIMKDSIAAPRSLLKYRNKSGWFVFFYLFVLSLAVSIGNIIYYVKMPSPEVVNSTETGCTILNNEISCTGDQYDITQEYTLYGYPVFFMDGDDSVEMIGAMPDQSLVFQGTWMHLYLGSESIQSLDLSPIMALKDFNGTILYLANIILVMSLILSFLGNVVMLLFVTLISTVPFLRLKRFISYKKIFKLVLFAITPFAILMTFYNLIGFPDIVLFVLMFVAYRSVLILQRELYFQTMQHFGAQGPIPPFGGTQPTEEDVSEPEEIERSDAEPKDDSEED